MWIVEQISFLLDGGDPITGLAGLSIGDFWRWAYSDVLSNRNRALLAEYLVGAALGVVDSPREEWASVDFVYRGQGIEVKSAGACQSWHQNAPSLGRFSIAKRLGWNAQTGEIIAPPRRWAAIYVFCYHAECERHRAKPQDALSWEFYVLTRDAIESHFGSAQSIGLSKLRRVSQPCSITALRACVDAQLG